MSSLVSRQALSSSATTVAHEAFGQRQGALRVAEVVGQQCQGQLARAVAFIGPFEAHLAELAEIEARDRAARHRR